MGTIRQALIKLTVAAVTMNARLANSFMVRFDLLSCMMARLSPPETLSEIELAVKMQCTAARAERPMNTFIA